MIPGTYTQTANKDNDYLIDRASQRGGNYSGIPGIRAEDAAVAESAGAIADRSLERLGTSDTAIIKMRQLLIAAAKVLQNGIEPATAKNGALYRHRSHSVVIEEDVDFDAKPEILAAMVV